MDETVFVPSIVQPQLPPADQVVELEVTFDTMNDGTNHAMFNMKTFNFPKVPTVFTQVEYANQNISEFNLVWNGASSFKLTGRFHSRVGFW